MDTKGEFSRAHGKSAQYDDGGKNVSIPKGEAPYLYKSNPSSDLNPGQSGKTTSQNQVTVSGK